MAEISLKEIMSYFGMSASEFMKAWKLMTDQDKTDIKSGLANGSYTY